jgi:hypothetical protein
VSEFAREVETWHDFFMLSGTAAATLLGLLFVAVSLRPDIRSQNNDSFQRTIVGHSFSNYLAVLLFSLYFLIPNQDRTGFAVEFFLTSLFPLVNLIRSFLRLRESPELTRGDRLWIFAIPMLCYLAGMIVAILLYTIDDSEISWFVPIVAFLLAVPTRSSLELILESDGSPS